MSKVENVKAAVVSAPGEIQLMEFPYPSVSEDAALLEVEYCGICGTDKHIFRGEAKLYGGTGMETLVPYPIILGHEIVGKIAELGKKANESLIIHEQYSLKPGDRVVVCPDIFCGRCFYCLNYGGFIWCDNMKTYGNNLSCASAPHLFGGWAEYMYLLPRTHVIRVPDEIPSEVAVLTELMVCTFTLDKAKEFYSMSGEGFRCGDTVVIQGVGPLGLCHVIKARILGAGTVIAIDGSEFRLSMAKRFGADVVINIRKTSLDERVAIIKELTSGRGADVVVECVGIPEAIPEGIALTRKGGMYITTGMFVDVGRTVAINPHRDLCAKNIRLLGSTNHPPSGYVPTLQLLLKYQKWFPPFNEIVTQIFPLENAQEALNTSLNADISMKVVIAPHLKKKEEHDAKTASCCYRARKNGVNS